MSDTRRVTLELVVDSRGGVVGVQAVNGELVKLTQTTKQAEGGITKLGLAVATGLGNLAADAVRALVGQLHQLASQAVAVGAAYESNLNELSAITGQTGEGLNKLADAARNFDGNFTPGEVVTGFKLMASAKSSLLEVEGALEAATRAALTLAQASGLDLPAAVDALANSLNQFEAGADQAERFTNVLAAGAKVGAAEVPEVTAALLNAGKTASEVGLSFETTNAALQVLAQGGLKGSEAGNQLKGVLLSLSTSTDAKINPTIVGLGAALTELSKRHLTVAQSAKLFGRENVNAASTLISGAATLKEWEQAVTGTTEATEQAKIRSQGLSAANQRLSVAFEKLSVDLFDKYGPSLTRLIDETVVPFVHLLADQLPGALTMATNGLRSLMGVLMGVGRVLGPVAAGAAVLVAPLAATWAYSMAARAAALAVELWAKAQALLNVAMRANPAGLLVAGVTVLATAIGMYRTKADEAAEAQHRFNQMLDEAREKFATLSRAEGEYEQARADVAAKVARARTEAAQREVDLLKQRRTAAEMGRGEEYYDGNTMRRREAGYYTERLTKAQEALTEATETARKAEAERAALLDVVSMAEDTLQGRLNARRLVLRDLSAQVKLDANDQILPGQDALLNRIKITQGEIQRLQSQLDKLNGVETKSLDTNTDATDANTKAKNALEEQVKKLSEQIDVLTGRRGELNEAEQIALRNAIEQRSALQMEIAYRRELIEAMEAQASAAAYLNSAEADPEIGNPSRIKGREVVEGSEIDGFNTDPAAALKDQEEKTEQKKDASEKTQERLDGVAAAAGKWGSTFAEGIRQVTSALGDLNDELATEQAALADAERRAARATGAEKKTAEQEVLRHKERIKQIEEQKRAARVAALSAFDGIVLEALAKVAAKIVGANPTPFGIAAAAAMVAAGKVMFDKIKGTVAGFEKGGLVEGGEQMIVVNEGNKPEWVVPAGPTAQYRPLLEAMTAGRSLAPYLRSAAGGGSGSVSADISVRVADIIVRGDEIHVVTERARVKREKVGG